MHYLLRPLCLFGRHARATPAWHDGYDFRSRCKRCAEPMYRDTIRRVWKPLDQRPPLPHEVSAAGMEQHAG
jgi:hypothetical protein